MTPHEQHCSTQAAAALMLALQYMLSGKDVDARAQALVAAYYMYMAAGKRVPVARKIIETLIDKMIEQAKSPNGIASVRGANDRSVDILCEMEEWMLHIVTLLPTAEGHIPNE